MIGQFQEDRELLVINLASCSQFSKLHADLSIFVFQGVSPHKTQQFRTHQLIVGTPGKQSESRRWCSECNKHFSRETVLKRHVATMHKGQYPYHCQYCGRGFAATNNLKGHLAKHTGVKAFKCHICEAAFSYSYMLKSHMRNFHSDEHCSITVVST